MDRTDEPWEVLKPIIPGSPRRADGRGRPWRAPRAAVNGMRWGLRTGAQGQALPVCAPPDQTCHRRFQRGVRSGVFARLLQALASAPRERGALARSACCRDGTIVVAQKGGAKWESPRGARVRRAWPWQTVLVFLSPSTLRRLRRLQSPLLRQLSPPGWAMLDPSTRTTWVWSSSVVPSSACDGIYEMTSKKAVKYSRPVGCPDGFCT
jgi:transposase